MVVIMDLAESEVIISTVLGYCVKKLSRSSKNIFLKDSAGKN